jgi:hypothetical protein
MIRPKKAGHRPAGDTVSDRLPGHSITTALHRTVDELVAAAVTERSGGPLELPVRG